MALCGLAGPFINLVIGINAYGVYCTMVWLATHPVAWSVLPFVQFILGNTYVIIAQIFGMIGYYNIILAIFNLLPVPPLDGSRLLYAFLPDKHYFGVMKHERVIMLVMLAFLWLGFFDLFIDGTYTLVAGLIEKVVYGTLDNILVFAST